MKRVLATLGLPLMTSTLRKRGSMFFLHAYHLGDIAEDQNQSVEEQFRSAMFMVRFQG